MCSARNSASTTVVAVVLCAGDHERRRRDLREIVPDVEGADRLEPASVVLGRDGKLHLEVPAAVDEAWCEPGAQCVARRGGHALGADRQPWRSRLPVRRNERTCRRAPGDLCDRARRPRSTYRPCRRARARTARTALARAAEPHERARRQIYTAGVRSGRRSNPPRTGSWGSRERGRRSERVRQYERRTLAGPFDVHRLPGDGEGGWGQAPPSVRC